MKFSYSLIKELVPGLPSKQKLVEALNLKSFEVEDSKGDVVLVEAPHNRYSNAVSHLGVAREAAAVFNLKLKELKTSSAKPGSRRPSLSVKISNPQLCPRYEARVFEIAKVGRSPTRLQNILKTCGLRPINAVVDIMNYAMLETGQPLHAFDAEKIEGNTIRVRLAKKNEPVTTLDNQKYVLNEETFVIADGKEPIAIAGVKGGKKAEVDSKTRKIVVESANFDRVSIYRTWRRLGLPTDAATRFSHGITPELTSLGMGRAAKLLEELVGARLLEAVDIYPKPVRGTIIEFDPEKFNSLIGTKLDRKVMINYLVRLGFEIKPGSRSGNRFLVRIPANRDDIQIFEDLVEEVARLHGYNELEIGPPVVSITPAVEAETVRLKDKIRVFLVASGFSEVYNYSFSSKKNPEAYELENPIASDKKYLRTNLEEGITRNLEDNAKFFDAIRIFELGDVFKVSGEELHLGLGIRLNKTKHGETFLALKGTVEHLLYGLGLSDFHFKPEKSSLEIHIDNQLLGGLDSRGASSALAELDLGRLTSYLAEEYEYRPIPKYPAGMRDLSLEVRGGLRVGEILSAIQAQASGNLRDVDLIDYYDESHFTFRLVFQSDQKTLLDKEVNQELEKIVSYLAQKFNARVR